jgi:hypothetical protein
MLVKVDTAVVPIPFNIGGGNCVPKACFSGPRLTLVAANFGYSLGRDLLTRDDARRIAANIAVSIAVPECGKRKALMVGKQINLGSARKWLPLLAAVTTILATVIGGVWTLQTYLVQRYDLREKAQEDAAAATKREQEQKIQALQQPFLIKVMTVNFEAAKAIGKLAALAEIVKDSTDPRWIEAELAFV